jgi:hypothetical protein
MPPDLLVELDDLIEGEEVRLGVVELAVELELELELEATVEVAEEREAKAEYPGIRSRSR